MDCSGAGTGENNNVALSFFFLANLISEGAGPLRSLQMVFFFFIAQSCKSLLCPIYWQSTRRQQSAWFGREHFANIALLNHLYFRSRLRYPPALSHARHRVCGTKMHDLIVYVNNKLLGRWTSRKVSQLISFNSAFTLENTCMFILD